MKPTKGYYSLIQYCPDLSRLEVANIGVMLFCPEPHFIRARTTNSVQRIRRFFGSQEHDWYQIREAIAAIEERLEVEGTRFRSVQDLENFIATRANEVQLTPPRPVKVFNPEQDLELLFQRLVGGPVRRRVVQSIADRLEETFAESSLDPLIRRDVTVPVPAFRREVTVPFGFQNGRFNLIQPTSFQHVAQSGAIYRPCHFAVEGRSLYEHPAKEFGNLQLIVVADFDATQQETQMVVKEILVENQVELFTTGELPGLIEEIRTKAKPHSAKAHDEAGRE